MILILQEYILASIKNIAIESNLNGIFLNVPQNSKFPYLYLGEFFARDISLMHQQREEVSFKIILFYRDKRAKNHYEIIKKIKSTLQSNQQISLQYESEKFITMTDGITEQIIINYKAMIKSC
jgi:hypothetical protein